jgi:hypothetical protein
LFYSADAAAPVLGVTIQTFQSWLHFKANGSSTKSAHSLFGKRKASPMKRLPKLGRCSNTSEPNFNRTRPNRNFGALGVDPDQIQYGRGKAHPDLTFTGHIAVGAGLPSAEYRFFDLHQHGDTVCGKAWHHEDRDDPGDMSKCYIQLSLVNGELYLKTKMSESALELNDLDFTRDPPIIAPPGVNCIADALDKENWGEWSTLVFVRQGNR